MSSTVNYGDKEARHGATKIVPGQAKSRLSSLNSQSHRSMNTLNTSQTEAIKKSYIEEFADMEETFRPHRTRNRRSNRNRTPSALGRTSPGSHDSASSDDELQVGSFGRKKDLESQSLHSRYRRERKEKSNPEARQDSEDELAEGHAPHSRDIIFSQARLVPANEGTHFAESQKMQDPRPTSPTTSAKNVEFSIQPTHNQPVQTVSYKWKFSVRAVVSGPHRIEIFDWAWPSTGPDADCVVPKPSPSKDKSLLDELDTAWAKVRIPKLQILKYARDSRYVLIIRCNEPGVESKLAAQFASSQEANRFVEAVGYSLPRKTRTLEIKEDYWLESCFRRMLVEQRAHQQRQTEQHSHAESSQTPRQAINQSPQNSVSHSTPPAPRNLLREQPKDTPSSSSLPTTSLRQTRSSGSILAFQGLLMERPRRRTRQIDTISLDIPKSSWTRDNPGWRERWKESLVYPRTGRDRATVDADDIERLDEGVFLNDNLILCYMRYLQQKHQGSLIARNLKVYFMNTYFFGVVKPTSKGASINYEGVQRWTNNVDLFEYDYIVVPINESTHWYIAIICHPGKLLPNAEVAVADEESEPLEDTIFTGDSQASSRKRPAGPHAPRIITLDSLGAPHSATCTVLRDYLYAEMAHRKNAKGEKALSLGITAKYIPQQTNYSDCGVFVLGFIEWFLKDPVGFTAAITEKNVPDCNFEPSELRNKIRETMFQLQAEHHAETLRLAAEKEALKLSRKAARLSRKALEDSLKTPPRLGSTTGSPVDGTGSSEPPASIAAFAKVTLQTNNTAPASPVRSKHVSMSSPTKPSVGSTLEKRKRESDLDALALVNHVDGAPSAPLSSSPHRDVTKPRPSSEESCTVRSEVETPKNLAHAPKRPRTQKHAQGEDDDDVEIVLSTTWKQQDTWKRPSIELKSVPIKIPAVGSSTPPHDHSTDSTSIPLGDSQGDSFLPDRKSEHNLGSPSGLPQDSKPGTSPSSFDGNATTSKKNPPQNNDNNKTFGSSPTDDSVSPFFTGHSSKYKITKKYAATAPKYGTNSALGLSKKPATSSATSSNTIIDLSN
ncbi:hypothetical protein Cpir12675_004103 [Ceratocystis pirilliformis]|uniref:Ubiquitin-like protease family profile domain-containing protein n=1 Tax=Ceratocystis pirilliformis TaxID=259994 RepID=A0ABR3YZG1_9PEZI